jgi:hypothetical protein
MTHLTGFGGARWNQARFLHPLLVYCAAALVTTWPLALHARTLLGASSGPGDPYLNLWILGWDMQTLLSRPAALFNGAIFNANIFYPATATLAYSDHLLLQSVLLSPLYAITPRRGALLQRVIDGFAHRQRTRDACVRAVRR